jgi:type IV secretion system protein VirB3
MLGGAPRQFSILNWTVCAALVLGLHAFYLFPLFVAFHILAVFFAKKDPYFFEVILRHLRQKRFYRV